MKILGLETSCDETAVSVVEGENEFNRPRFRVLAHLVSSQVEIHKPWGGVVPGLAKREHARNLVPLLQQALNKTNLLIANNQLRIPNDKEQKLEKILEREPELLLQLLDFLPKYDKPEIDAIAVTRGPGLEPALWVGVNFARALSLVWNLPVVAVNHLEGHMLSPLVEDNEIKFPTLALLISGGHTELVLIKNWLRYRVIGQTRDDAVGEAFDKVARILGLPYPGGPAIEKLASGATGEAGFTLPRPMINSGDLDFSFSGLKTAVLYLVQKNPEINKAAVAREFQQAAIDVLLAKTLKAIEKCQPKSLIVAGGVVANQALKKQFAEKLAKDFPDVQLLVPAPELSTDNATMIAIAGYFHALKNNFVVNIKADGNLML